MITVGCDRATSLAAIAVAAGHAGVCATVGLHPHDAVARRRHDRRPARRRPAIVAVGEAGLDYYYDHSPRDVQRDAFAAQIQLAHERTAAARDPHPRRLGRHVRHPRRRGRARRARSSTASPAAPTRPARCLDSGAFVSFSGIVTFKSADRRPGGGARCARSTGCSSRPTAPYLAPVPHRGRPNQPAWVPLVGRFIAELRGMTDGACRRAPAPRPPRLAFPRRRSVAWIGPPRLAAPARAACGEPCSNSTMTRHSGDWVCLGVADHRDRAPAAVAAQPRRRRQPARRHVATAGVAIVARRRAADASAPAADVRPDEPLGTAYLDGYLAGSTVARRRGISTDRQCPAAGRRSRARHVQQHDRLDDCAATPRDAAVQRHAHGHQPRQQPLRAVRRRRSCGPSRHPTIVLAHRHVRRDRRPHRRAGAGRRSPGHA